MKKMVLSASVLFIFASTVFANDGAGKNYFKSIVGDVILAVINNNLKTNEIKNMHNFNHAVVKFRGKGCKL